MALGHSLTAAQVSDVNALWITVTVAWAMAPVALWLWMAWACGQGPELGPHPVDGAVRPGDGEPERLVSLPVFQISVVLTVFGPTILVLTWLAGAAAVWLLWRPGSTAFFKPPGYTRAQHRAQIADRAHQAQMAELARSDRPEHRSCATREPR